VSLPLTCKGCIPRPPLDTWTGNNTKPSIYYVSFYVYKPIIKFNLKLDILRLTIVTNNIAAIKIIHCNKIM
jgi:hypothetical protein